MGLVKKRESNLTQSHVDQAIEIIKFTQSYYFYDTKYFRKIRV
jgi:hypothetical protein